MDFKKQLKAHGWTQKQLARALAIRQSSVSRWGVRGVPAERVLGVEQITGISRHDLRPDLYPRSAVYAPDCLPSVGGV